MMRNKTVAVIASAAFLVMTGCASKAPEETTTAATTQAVETTETAPEETTEAVSGDDSTKEYILTDEARGELESVFKNCFYFEMGHDSQLIFTELSVNDAAEILCTTFLSPDSYLKKGMYQEGTGYVVSRDDLAQYLKDGFGADLDTYDFSDPNGMLKDNGDTYFFLGGDYGMAGPDAIINTVVQDPESGIVTVTGDALFIDEGDGAINPYLFTATLQPSDSIYFGGGTLISFEYETNTTGIYPDIKAEDYGLDSIHYELR